MTAADDRDPGAAAERTTLAWHRTGISAAAAAALSLRVFVHRPPLGPALVALFVVVVVVSYLPDRQRARSSRQLLVVTGCVSVAAVLSLALALAAP